MNGGVPVAAKWRALLLGVTAVAGALVVLVVLAKTAFGWNGDPQWTLAPSHARYVVSVASVTPDGAAARAGVRTGDRIDLRTLAFDDRVLLVASPIAGRPIAIELRRDGAVRRAVIVPVRTTMAWSGWIAYAVLFWMVAFAALIAWRRPAMREARLLSLAMSCYVAGDTLQFLSVPAAPLDLAFAALSGGGILAALALASFLRFTEVFGCPLRGARRVLNAIAYVATAAMALFGVAGAFALGSNAIDPVPLFFGMQAAALICGVQLVVILAGIGAIAACRGLERQRVAWAVASFGTLYAASIAQVAFDTIYPTTDMALGTQAAVNVVAVAAPVGLTYAVLSRRLLDIGFALNRAAVFSAVSLIVVGAFMGIEWALGNWLQSFKPLAGTLVALALAIALGFSIKYLHHRVDHAIDRIFFRKRHEQERALLRFANEASFVTSAEALLERTIDEMERHTDATRATVLRYDGIRDYAVARSTDAACAPVDENDAAIVALRATKSAVDLHRLVTNVDGEYAFPMVCRGELIGALVCGPKHHGDPYAPDEIAVLTTLAHTVGAALDVLTAREGGANALLALRVEVAALRDDVRVLLAALRATETR